MSQYRRLRIRSIKLDIRNLSLAATLYGNEATAEQQSWTTTKTRYSGNKTSGRSLPRQTTNGDLPGMKSGYCLGATPSTKPGRGRQPCLWPTTAFWVDMLRNAIPTHNLLTVLSRPARCLLSTGKPDESNNFSRDTGFYSGSRDMPPSRYVHSTVSLAEAEQQNSVHTV